MAVVSNVNRQAAAKAIVAQVKALRLVTGLSIQTHRAYESASRGGKGLTQKDVAVQANTSQPIISKLENGGDIPPDVVLEGILCASGFNMGRGAGGQALLSLLKTIRDNARSLERVVKEKPQ